MAKLSQFLKLQGHTIDLQYNTICTYYIGCSLARASLSGFVGSEPARALAASGDEFAGRDADNGADLVPPRASHPSSTLC